SSLNIQASLLAMRPVQTTLMLNVRPLSRAGSLPQIDHWPA
ncbi:transposase, partial [Pseudomonas sp. MWU12-2312b]